MKNQPEVAISKPEEQQKVLTRLFDMLKIIDIPQSVWKRSV